MPTHSMVTPKEVADLQAVRPRTSALPRNGDFLLPDPDPNIKLPKAGDSFGLMFRITPELADAMTAAYAKDFDAALTALDAAERAGGNDMQRYFMSLMRAQVMLVTGHTDLQREAVKTAMAIEIARFGNNVDSLSRMGEERLWSGDLDAAAAYYGRVLTPLAEWRLPKFFYYFPLNIPEVGHAWIAQSRAFTGLAGTRILQGDFAAAIDWGLAGEERFKAMIELTDNPLYGLFIKPTSGFYLAHGWNLTMLAGAIVGESRSLEKADPLFARARDYFRAGHFIDADLAVDSVREYVSVRTGLSPSRTERIGVLPEPTAGEIELTNLLGSEGPGPTARETVSLPIPEVGSVSMPDVGEPTIYGFAVTPALSLAFSHYLAGEADKAITALDAAGKEVTGDPLRHWYLAYLRAQVLILMGRAADAEGSIGELDKLERTVFDTNLNARALRGEARLWIGDADGAIADFAQVMQALDGWRLPTLFVFPPAKTPVTVALTRAHFRALMGMAGALMLKQDYAQAEKWAERAEDVFTDVFYVVHHPLYRSYAAIDPDIYYLRGVNLGILGAARLAIQRDPRASDPLFDAANAYFDALGYAAGRATVDAFRIRALMDIDRADLAAPLAADAGARAAAQGLADAVWRIQAMHGEALLSLGKRNEAETAYRTADAAVTLVSGALSSDQAKQRFGIGKEDITRNLVDIDAAKGDMEALFSDMERGRARAFVDLLGERPLALGRETERVDQIRTIDSEIRGLRLKNAAPGLATNQSIGREKDLLSKRAETIADLARRDPEVAELLSVSTRNLTSIKARLGPNTALAYFLPSQADKPIRVLLVNRDGARLVTAAMTPEGLDDTVSAFRGADPYGTADVQTSAAQAIVEGLGIADWGPLRILYVVPSGSAYFIPWGALDRDTAVVVMPTGGWLLRDAFQVVSATPATVIGDPDMERPWPQLPGARAEARSVAGILGVNPMIGPDATENEVRRRLGSGSDVLHIATHGFFDAADPMRSGVVLSAGGKNRGMLTAADIFARPLPARMVVLSACETGAGAAVAGDDFLGLSRSFYLGGTIAMVNTLYPVVDQPTRLYMETFHRVAIGGDYGRAWLAARDTLKSAGQPPAVYGAFVLGGTARVDRPS